MLSTPRVPHSKFRVNQWSFGHRSRSPRVLPRGCFRGDGKAQQEGCLCLTWASTRTAKLAFVSLVAIPLNYFISTKVPEARRVEYWGEDQPEKMLQTREKAMASHSTTLAWKIPWMEEPGRLQSMGSLRVGHDSATSLFTFHFHALEKEMATHSSVPAWRIPWTEKPGRLQSMGSHRVGHDWGDAAAAAAGRAKGFHRVGVEAADALWALRRPLVAASHPAAYSRGLSSAGALASWCYRPLWDRMLNSAACPDSPFCWPQSGPSSRHVKGRLRAPMQ